MQIKVCATNTAAGLILEKKWKTANLIKEKNSGVT